MVTGPRRLQHVRYDGVLRDGQGPIHTLLSHMSSMSGAREWQMQRATDMPARLERDPTTPYPTHGSRPAVGADEVGEEHAATHRARLLKEGGAGRGVAHAPDLRARDFILAHLQSVWRGASCVRVYACVCVSCSGSARVPGVSGVVHVICGETAAP